MHLIGERKEKVDAKYDIHNLHNYLELADAVIRMAICDCVKSKNAFIRCWKRYDAKYLKRMNLYAWDEIMDAENLCCIVWDRYQAQREWFRSEDFEFYNRGRYDPEYILDKEAVTFVIRKQVHHISDDEHI